MTVASGADKLEQYFEAAGHTVGRRYVASGKRLLASGKCTFKQIDVTRALRAAVAAGIVVHRYEIHKDGMIVVVALAATSTNEHATDFDKWKANHARQP